MITLIRALEPDYPGESAERSLWWLWRVIAEREYGTTELTELGADYAGAVSLLAALVVLRDQLLDITSGLDPREEEDTIDLVGPRPLLTPLELVLAAGRWVRSVDIEPDTLGWSAALVHAQRHRIREMLASSVGWAQALATLVYRNLDHEAYPLREPIVDEITHNATPDAARAWEWLSSTAY